MTPKHIGLGMTIHQATRSKHLIDLEHQAGHSVSYDTVRRADTSIAKHALEKYKEHDNIFIPTNIQAGHFAQYAADNIDILEETLDGKNTFHATQMVVWQRGPTRDVSQELFPIQNKKNYYESNYKRNPQSGTNSYA